MAAQLYLSYGEGKDNDALLQDYGFVERDNPADRVWLRTTRFKEGGAGDGHEGSGGAAATGRWVTWPSALVADEDLRRCCAVQLSGMPTSLEEDEAELSCEEGAGSRVRMTPRRKLALEWRVERKRILACAAREDTVLSDD